MVCPFKAAQNMPSHPLYGLLNPNVTPHPKSSDLEATSIGGKPFPDSIKEAVELKDTKNKNGGAESLTASTMDATVFESGLAHWRGRPL